MTEPPLQPRLFVALDLPPEAERAIAAVVADLETLRAEVRWIRQGKAHLTLKFIGEVDAAMVSRIEAALEQVAWPAPFHLALDGLGRFPPRGPARVVWCGLRGDLAALTALAGRLEETLAGCGIARESRPFAPHVTLGRVRGHRRLRALEAGLEARSAGFHVELPPLSRVILFRSELLPAGARYTVVRSFELR